MKARAKLDAVTLERWHATHTDWERVSGDSIAREFKFKDFKSALAFVNKIGEIAEKKNHHPDITLGWGRVRVVYTTHDAGGLTQLDLDMAEATDKLA
jgi:4a-hydroxytetrahydrobiopterin dehydratase